MYLMHSPESKVYEIFNKIIQISNMYLQKLHILCNITVYACHKREAFCVESSKLLEFSPFFSENRLIEVRKCVCRRILSFLISVRE